MAEYISIQTDLDEVMRFLNSLEGNKDKMRRRILSGIGTATKNYVKKQYRGYLKKNTGMLYKSLSSRVIRSGKAVIISPTAEKNKVRYGYVLAKGTTIRPRHSEYLTFQIDGKWIRKHSVIIQPRNWVEEPASRYISGIEFKKKLDALVKREIARAEKQN